MQDQPPKRRLFLGGLLAGSAALTAGLPLSALAAGTQASPPARQYLVKLLERIAEPVFSAMAEGKLKQTFELELSPTWDGRPKEVAYLECFGRLLSACAPWFALPDDDSAEGRSRKRLRQLALKSLAHAVDPASPDFLLWQGPPQVLVDSAYISSAMLRAPAALWEPLDAATRGRIVEVIKGIRSIESAHTNWLLFASMNEAFLLSVGEKYDPLRLTTGVRKMREWYVGDGWIKDGDTFHFDYYNAFVIYPMLVTVLQTMVRYKASYWGAAPADLLAQATRRMQRYSEHLERYISPTGTYPPIGRSITYRTAAFQPLAFLALHRLLPASLPEGQVRAALEAVHRAIWTPAGNFGKGGFLTIGFAGHQPTLGDWYSNTGSMYIAAESLITLGLPASDSYWTAPALDWTQKKAFANQPFPKDYHVDY
ncbi:DUF2264 domain-containing protein [Pseudoduganella lutea]|uniref:DUF2264 domain-containing protein n=2 Tax=Pseudoduganella lutea TaxID=321985 RepID=A0A4P6L5T2_9BURK|nr:DUF2264 domain-containing protein [Pseudoduganella lutea]